MKNIRNRNKNGNKIYDVAIIGSGAAGCTAAIYATRYSLETVFFGGPLPGGLITEALDVENYPGFLHISGIELANKFISHAKNLGAEYIEDVVNSIVKQNNIFLVKTSAGNLYKSKSIILAMGTHHRKLGVPGEKEFEGKGVSYCSTCDGPFFKDKVVAVVGGGNSAVEGAQDVSAHASRVYIIYRSDLKAAPLYVENMRKIKKIIEVPQRNVIEIKGDKKVTSVVLDKEFKGNKELKVDGIFIHIGYIPSNEIAQSLGCEITKYGYVKVNAAMETTVKGVFCAGDLNNASNLLHQQVTSAGEGAVAAQGVFRYLRGFSPVIES